MIQHFSFTFLPFFASATQLFPLRFVIEPPQLSSAIYGAPPFIGNQSVQPKVIRQSQGVLSGAHNVSID